MSSFVEMARERILIQFGVLWSLKPKFTMHTGFFLTWSESDSHWIQKEKLSFREISKACEPSTSHFTAQTPKAMGTVERKGCGSNPSLWHQLLERYKPATQPMSSYLVHLHIIAFKEVAYLRQWHKHDGILLQGFLEGSKQVLHLR